MGCAFLIALVAVGGWKELRADFLSGQMGGEIVFFTCLVLFAFAFAISLLPAIVAWRRPQTVRVDPASVEVVGGGMLRLQQLRSNRGQVNTVDVVYTKTRLGNEGYIVGVAPYLRIATDQGEATFGRTLDPNERQWLVERLQEELSPWDGEPVG